MTKYLSRSFFVLLFAVLAFPKWSVAQGHGQGNPHNQKNQDVRDQDDRDDNDQGDRGRAYPVFHDRDRRIIIEFFNSHQSSLPPGLAKRNGDLPPGLEKHLERNGTLPPGLQKKVEPLPHDLEVRLPRLPDIYCRRRVGPHVIILNQKTGAIVDIIRDVAVLSRR